MDTLKFTCQSCGVHIRADLDMCGDSVACPHCQHTIMVPMPGIRPGMLITRYRIDRRLGVGGMGEVWLARHASMDRLVALKILSPALVRNPIFIQRFLHEAKMAGRLIHPHIVTAYDAGVDQGIYYLATAYVEGRQLERLIRENKHLPEEQALRITLQIASALEFAWQQHHMIHRDIKPANIMIDEDGRARLMDLGISKRMEEKDPSLTSTGQFVGTPYYVSPEQAKSLQDVDFRSDIYALGITLFHMVTGEVPFRAKSTIEILEMHLNKQPPSPQELNPLVSNPCCALIEIMMAKAPADRPPSWDMVLLDVREVLAGRFPRTPSPAGSRYAVMRELMDKLHPARAAVRSKRSPRLRPWGGFPRSRSLPYVFAGILLALLVVTAFLISSAHFEILIHPSDEQGPAEQDPPTEAETLAQQETWQHAMEIVARAEAQPETLDAALAHLEGIRGELEGSPYASRAGREFQRLLARRERLITALLQDLDNRAEAWIGDNRLLEAAMLYERYEGPYRDRIRAERLNRASDLRRRLAEEERERMERWAMLERTRGDIAAWLIEGRLRPALAVTENEEYHEALREERTILTQVADGRTLLMEGLRARIGRPIRIMVDRVEQSFRLHSVSGTSLFVEERVSAGILVREYPIQNLPAEERDRTLQEAGMRDDALALIRGMEAAALSDFDTARDHFLQTGVLAPYLEEQIRTQTTPSPRPVEPPVEEQTDAHAVMPQGEESVRSEDASGNRNEQPVP